MATTTLCPQCAQAVAVPDFASPSAHVRCARCNAEYQLADALSHDAPELIVLSDPELLAAEPESLTTEEPSTDPESLTEPNDLETDEIAAADADQPHVDFTYMDEATADAETSAVKFRDDEGSPSPDEPPSTDDDVSLETDADESPSADDELEEGAEPAVSSTVATKSGK